MLSPSSLKAGAPMFYLFINYYYPLLRCSIYSWILSNAALCLSCRSCVYSNKCACYSLCIITQFLKAAILPSQRLTESSLSFALSRLAYQAQESYSLYLLQILKPSKYECFESIEIFYFILIIIYSSKTLSYVSPTI